MPRKIRIDKAFYLADDNSRTYIFLERDKQPIEVRLALCYSSVKIFGEEAKMQAYCVKDRKMVEIKNPKSITMKNGRPLLKGLAQFAATRCSVLEKPRSAKT
jgi:hypothetical protein